MHPIIIPILILALGWWYFSTKDLKIRNDIVLSTVEVAVLLIFGFTVISIFGYAVISFADWLLF